MTTLRPARGDDVDQREAALVVREALLVAQLAKLEADRVGHREAAGKVCDAAAERDAEADARDRVAATHDHDADLLAFTSPGGSGYGADLPARRHAALDRRDAKVDRTASADDRATLSGVLDDPSVHKKRRPE